MSVREAAMLLAAMTVAAILTGLIGYVVGFDNGVVTNRVTPQDMTAFIDCLNYYHNAPQCWQDTIESWQR